MPTPTNSGSQDPKSDENKVSFMKDIYNQVNELLRWTDTVEFRFKKTLSECDLLKFPDYYREDHEMNGVKQMSEKYENNVILLNGENVHLEYRPYPYTGKPLLWVSLSIPKTIIGNNYAPIPKGTDNIAILNGILSTELGLPEDCNILFAEISKIHLSVNIYLGDLVEDVFKILRERYMPRRKRETHSNPSSRNHSPERDNGVVFCAYGLRFSIYDKGKETPEGKGWIRLEIAFEGAKQVNRLFTHCLPVLVNLSVDQIVNVINEHVTAIGFDVPTTCSFDSFRAILVEKYGGTKGLVLHDFWEMMNEHNDYSSAELAKMIGKTRATVCNHKRDLKKAGIAGAGKSVRSLPDLLVTRDSLDDIFYKVPNDIRGIILNRKMPTLWFKTDSKMDYLNGLDANLGLKSNSELGLCTRLFGKCRATKHIDTSEKLTTNLEMQWHIGKHLPKSVISKEKQFLYKSENALWLPNHDLCVVNTGLANVNPWVMSSPDLDIPNECNKLSTPNKMKVLEPTGNLSYILDLQTFDRSKFINWLMQEYQTRKIPLAYFTILLALCGYPAQPIRLDLAKKPVSS